MSNKNQRLGKRIMFTGQTGLDKSQYLNEVIDKCESDFKHKIILFNLGDLMYEEAEKIGGKIREGKILNLPILRLNLLRRCVFKDVIAYCRENPNNDVIINSHSCFRWRHGLFFAFDFDMLKELNIDMYITLIDDVDSIYYRIIKNENIEEKYTLKDIIVWREEEISLTQIIASSLGADFYVIPRKNPIKTVLKLIYKPEIKKAYLSFPITKVVDKPEIVEKINKFKELMAEKLVIWDPITIEERRILRYINEERKPIDIIEIETLDNKLSLTVNEINSIRKDIDGQIISRDYLLINQSDMIITYIPEIEGDPDISAGCQTEMHYAYELPREVYVLWESEKEPSPWIQQHSTKIFSGEKMFEEILAFFKERRYFN